MASKYKIYSYENLRYNAKQYFREIIELSDFEINEEIFYQVLKKTEFKNMQEDELNQKKNKSKNFLHVREGKIFGYLDHMSPSTIKKIENFLVGKLEPIMYKFYVSSIKNN